ncbi:RrF2 family transcriptional regulator [Actinocatenispora sera]|uniref:Transcriptional regulator n=1 Tax=Actinocatenispora sera TaxID=390989 RepID=A0A810KTV1_9ACTN|nr:Rrf2 family transcriptional regulator [Actinocatenispora sera]BCJ26287.1 transcriptional regulator [Actinocatenispora sera]
MKLPESCEWVLHSAAALAQLSAGDTASTGQLAEHFGVPAPYLAKQLAHLVRAGVLTASTGPRGGFRLARPADRITVLDVVEAVDGGADPYQCRELRQQGRGAAPAAECTEPCALAATMRTAHEAWRASLAAVSLADIVGTLPAEIPDRTRRLLARPR